MTPAGAILFVHGLGESSLCFARLRDRPEFAGRRLLVPDLPGYGATPAPTSGPLSLIDHADQLVARLHEEGETSAVILGHSMGGVIALLMAERHPEVVRGVIDVDGNKSPGDCVFSGRAVESDLATFLSEGFDRLRETVRRRGLRDRAQAGYHRSMMMADGATFHRNSAELVEMSAREDMARRLAALPVPTLYVAGVPDGASPRTHELLAEAGVDKVDVEPSGHWPFIDRTDAFCESAARWLDHEDARR